MKTLLLFLLLPAIGFSQGQKILQQDYSLPLSNNEITTLHQSNDTLYELRCYTDKQCEPDPFRHYKIISSAREGKDVFLKLEQLDTIPYPSKSLSETRYSVLALKDVNDDKLGYLPLSSGLKKWQLDAFPISAHTSQESFFFTFYSAGYMKDLSALPKVTTKDEAKQIVEAFQNSNFQPLQKNLGDEVYTTRYLAELMNRACIAKRFNPIGAGRTIEQLMK